MSRQLHTNQPDADLIAADAVARAVSVPPAVTFSSISVTYRRGRAMTSALVDFNLRIAIGETVALLGPGGAGKSTAIKTLAGLIRPSHGRILLGDRDITDVPPAKRGNGIFVHSFALFPHIKVADNVAAGLKARGYRRSELATRVAETLDMVGMRAYARRLPRELSGLQQHRVAMARALVVKPDVLLLDEPLAALDVDSRRCALTELRQLRKSVPETAMVYATRNRNDALVLADRIAIMRDAHLVDVDTPDRLWDRPSNRFVATLLGAANLIACTVGRVYGHSALVTVGDRMLSALAHSSSTGARRWAPQSPAYLCIRPHDIHVCSPTDPIALPARVLDSVWCGASTRLTLAVDGIDDQPLLADVAGRAIYLTGAQVGVKLPPQSCVLVERDT
ncbi:putative ABC transporter ATP-binding protein [Gordonia effusa NBRC 100432]|uniref:Putative ABC transporter ATP-binding protein n=1 Tax=Gordonia effusa NBRC 100432 TaxID=1077974 RepID=H0QUJ6_9ACTN|nr:ABC transporter ATP-binding protein [Gordonia effusa]GAB16497.1 putative ABC transporter ATP-binding protein [Gordonia effusa NBRC 100432]